MPGHGGIPTLIFGDANNTKLYKIGPLRYVVRGKPLDI
jgi:hypothetical protein